MVEKRRNKWGRMEVVVGYRVISEDIYHVRCMLGLADNTRFWPHITCLVCEL